MRIRRLGFVLVLILLMVSTASGAPGSGSPQAPAPESRRLIVELPTPSVAATHKTVVAQPGQRRQLNVRGAAEQAQFARIRAEQDKLLREIAKLQGIKPGRLIDERGSQRDARFGLLVNAIAVDVDANEKLASAVARLLALPGVKAVHRDRLNASDLHASLPLIDAPVLWSHPLVGTRANAGAGVKLASVDGGLHHDAPMFSGAGFSYPSGYPLGFTSNTNGKIIASRAYFRASDPPAPGDENPWPGLNGTSHGVHTGSTAAGNTVSAWYFGLTPTLSGVAPGAWVMSYRVFYPATSGASGFYDVEGIAALEDVVADGADVVNNSWGGGPTSIGGPLDPLDQALINASAAGVFVSMSMGNAGPGIGTGDHPSSDYISVAATTTGSMLVAGRASVTAPAPVPATLENIATLPAQFGPPFPAGVLTPYSYAALALVATNEACAPLTPGEFSGKLALIQRGTCDFSVKVLNAQNAGAVAAIVYNHAAGGDALVSMGAGVAGGSVTIPSLFIGNTDGVAMRNWWIASGAPSALVVDMIAYDVGNVADVVANFSSRGPGVGGVLKPDIAAPGVSILAQGYTPGAIGEARHLGYGMSSGTSMAAPHVAGAAAVLRQIHPGWSNDWIKSALMTTSQFLNIYNEDGSPAQPLDMGAGRMALASAADPGIIAEPPSLTFPFTPIGTVRTRTFRITSVTDHLETWTISTRYTGGGFVGTTPLSGVTVTPNVVPLAPGGSAVITVTWDSAASLGLGDNQGYIVLSGDAGHAAHLPVWMRVVPVNRDSVVVLDNDGSTSLGNADYAYVYTTALGSLGIPFTLTDLDASAGSPVNMPEPGILAENRVLIYETGDYIYPNGSFTVPTPPTAFDSGRMIDSVNSGGRVIAFGQNLSKVVGRDSILYRAILGASWVQDSVSGGVVLGTPQLLQGVPGSPFEGLSVDISTLGDGFDNQVSVDELLPFGFQQPVLFYVPGEYNLYSGYVALFHHDEPTLERRGRTFLGRALYFSFGLEGVNNDTGYNTREELLERAMNVVSDTASVELTVTLPDFSFMPVQFDAVMSSTHGGPGVTYRWDFGDGSAYAMTATGHVEHPYATPGTYFAAVEAINAFGTHAIGERTVIIPEVAQTAPIMIGATATSTSAATISWHAVPGTQSEVWRSSGGAPFTLRTTVSGASWSDTGLAPDTTYLYKVRASSSGTKSPFSAIDAATTVIFIDPALSGVPVKAVHLTQLRTAVNAMRHAAGLSAYAFTDPVVTNVLMIRLVHVDQLRTALAAARAAIEIVPIVWTDPVLSSGSTKVRAVHFQEVRAGTM